MCSTNKCALPTCSLVTSRSLILRREENGEPGEKHSKHGRDQQLCSHKFQVRQST